MASMRCALNIIFNTVHSWPMLCENISPLRIVCANMLRRYKKKQKTARSLFKYQIFAIVCTFDKKCFGRTSVT